MNLEITGKLITLLPEQTGQGKNGPWTKQEFILETEDQYPKKICISGWNDTAKLVQAIKPFSSVKLSISIESREYNGRWYTDVRAWKIEAIAGTGNASSSAPMDTAANAPDPLEASLQQDQDDLPF